MKDIEKMDNSTEIKAILLGEAGVGKTNLLNTSIGLNFNENIAPTIASSYMEKIININGKNYIILLNLFNSII